MTGQSQDELSEHVDDRRAHHDPPVGLAFVGFVVAMIAALVLHLARAVPAGLDSATTELGVMAVTLFGASGLLCVHRATVARDRVAGLIAVVVLCPGAAWSWLTFVSSSGARRELTASLVSLAAAVVAIGLLVRGFRSARWLEVFSGLGSLSLALATGGIRTGTGSTAVHSAPALLAAVAGMTVLYGLLVEIEISEHRSIQQLRLARQQLETESRHNDDLLHDLRSGLLSIEAASSASSTSLADPVRCEAARLRRLTARTASESVWFDLVPGIADLVGSKRAAGMNVEFVAPTTAPVFGDESDLLSIVENLLANAERHGRAPVVVDLGQHQGIMKLTVTDAGDGVPPSVAEQLFARGVSSHPNGSGFGLDHARRLANHNNAELVLEGTSSGGASFALIMRSMAEVAAS